LLGSVLPSQLIGMVERWNTGKIGLGILQYWVNVNIGHALKLRTDKFPQEPNIPSFLYSIIP
jgi:hypothetical protein